MPLYFFNVRHRPGQAGLAVDPEGEVYPDLDAAGVHALSMARSMIVGEPHIQIHDWMVCSFEIMDEQNRLVLTVPFSDAVQEHYDNED